MYLLHIGVDRRSLVPLYRVTDDLGEAMPIVNGDQWERWGAPLDGPGQIHVIIPVGSNVHAMRLLGQIGMQEHITLYPMGGGEGTIAILTEADEGQEVRLTVTVM